MRWAVVGSGFWKGQRRHPKEGATTSFGLWDTEAQPGRRDAFPNPRYPDIDGFKKFFKERDLPLIIGLRINFKARGEDGGHYHPPHDGPFTAEALERGYFIADAEGIPETWNVNFPQGPVHLLEGGKTYSDYPLPPEKIPLFVGGDGIFVLRKDGELFAYYFPLNEGSVEYTFTFPDGKSTSTIVTLATTKGDITVTTADGAAVEIESVPDRNGYFFPIEPGKRYAIK